MSISNERVNQVLEVINGGIKIEEMDGKDVAELKNRASMKAIMTALLGRAPEDDEVSTDAYSVRSFSYSTDAVKADLPNLNNNWNVVYHHPYEASKWKRPFIKLVRKIMSPVLYPLYMQQASFNASTTRAINELANHTEVLKNFLDYQNNMNRENVNLRTQVSKLEKANADAKKRIEELERSLEELTAQVNYVEEDKLDYKAFEDAFRGAEEEIKAKLEWYVPYFQGKNNVFDLGCGRGEFLELLADNNIPARGVDIYTPFVEDCKKKGLEVWQNDAVSLLKTLKDDEIDGVMLTQVAEHLSDNDLIEVIELAYKKLATGGVMAMETPNPMCLSVYRNAFYLDPSHTTPVHPKYLEFLFKNAGFSKVEVVFTEPSKMNYRLPLLNVANCANLAEFNDGLNVLSDMLFGSQDYSIIATK